MRLLIMAGGTGGHIYPALTIADALQKQGIEIHWLGTQTGLETRLVPAAGIPISYLSITGLRGKRWKKLVCAPWQIARAIWQAHRIIRQLKPDMVLGMGGYASGPGGIAAWLQRIPFVIHEQNAKAGLTNRILAYFAMHVFAGFPGTLLQHSAVTVSGNPVRSTIQAMGPKQISLRHEKRPLRLLVFGGSQGAQYLNELMPQVLAQLPLGDFEIWHQTGVKQWEMTQSCYPKNKHIKILPYIDDMASAYQWADIVISRAGAATIAELAAVGMPSILIPYPYAVDNHQWYNAKYLADAGGAKIMTQAELNTEKLIECLMQWRDNPDLLQHMGAAAYQQRHENTIEEMTAFIIENARKR